MFWAQSTIRNYIRVEGNFHKEVYSLKDQYGRNKTGRTEWENGELSGECMEWNTAERAIKRQKQTQEQNEKEWASSVGLCQDTHWQIHVRLVRWCFQPSQPQRITSGLNTNFTLSSSYSFHKSSYHKSCFCLLAYFRGHSTREPASSRVTYFILGAYTGTGVSHSQQETLLERFWKKFRWMDRKAKNK